LVEVLPTQDKSTECWTGAVPEPDRATVEGEFVALLTKEIDPEKGPLVSGAKLIFTVFVVPAATLKGMATAELKTPPVRFAAETETEVFPVFDNVMVWLDVFPTRTLPNDTADGDALNVSVEGAVAEPDRLTDGALFEALLATVSVPVKFPVAVGANWIGNDADCPAAIVNGNAAPLVLNVPPVTVAPVTDMLLAPVFEINTLCVEVVFVVMLPNETEVGETAIWAGSAVTVTAADAIFVVSATLLAVTV
jgi:hypothetical protein